MEDEQRTLTQPILQQTADATRHDNEATLTASRPFPAPRSFSTFTRPCFCHCLCLSATMDLFFRPLEKFLFASPSFDTLDVLLQQATSQRDQSPVNAITTLLLNRKLFFKALETFLPHELTLSDGLSPSLLSPSLLPFPVLTSVLASQA